MTDGETKDFELKCSNNFPNLICSCSLNAVLFHYYRSQIYDLCFSIEEFHAVLLL
jgi:hypothetical protein